MGLRSSSGAATCAATPVRPATLTSTSWSPMAHETSGRSGLMPRRIGSCASMRGFAMYPGGSHPRRSRRTGRSGCGPRSRCGCAGSPTNRGEPASTGPSWSILPASRNWSTSSATWARSPMPTGRGDELAPAAGRAGSRPLLPGVAAAGQSGSDSPGWQPSRRTARGAGGRRRSAWLPRRPAGLPRSCWQAEQRRGGACRRVPPGDWRDGAGDVACGYLHPAAASTAVGVTGRWQPAPLHGPGRRRLAVTRAIGATSGGQGGARRVPPRRSAAVRCSRTRSAGATVCGCEGEVAAEDFRLLANLAAAEAFLALRSHVSTARKQVMNPLAVLRQLVESRPWLPAPVGY